MKFAVALTFGRLCAAIGPVGRPTVGGAEPCEVGRAGLLRSTTAQSRRKADEATVEKAIIRHSLIHWAVQDLKR